MKTTSDIIKVLSNSKNSSSEQNTTTKKMSSEIDTLPQKEKPDRVTIGMYSTETVKTETNMESQEMVTTHSFNSKALDQLDNIANMREKFVEAAKQAERQPPEFVLMVNLIPDWQNGSNYENEQYKDNKAGLMRLLDEKIDSNEKYKGIIYKNFYDELDKGPEKDYLQKLESLGSNADMIKTHAIIDPDNRDRRHLQLDSNTKIFDYKAFYNQTFGAQEQKDALNASYYDDKIGYVSAHNKIVYTTPGGKIAENLESVHLNYCKQHANDHLDENKKQEKTDKNSIYSKDFTVSLSDHTVGLTLEHTLLTGEKKTIYSAMMDQPEYRITENIITVVNKSWGKEKKPQELIELEALPAIPVGEATFDYNCFVTTQRKYTEPLVNHYPNQTSPYDDKEAYQQLMNISNVQNEQMMIKDFIINVAEKAPEKLDKLLDKLSQTPRAKDFYCKMFDISYSSNEEIDLKQKVKEKLEEIVTPKNTMKQESTSINQL